MTKILFNIYFCNSKAFAGTQRSMKFPKLSISKTNINIEVI